jgi:hypothetical protein
MINIELLNKLNELENNLNVEKDIFKSIRDTFEKEVEPNRIKIDKLDSEYNLLLDKIKEQGIIEYKETNLKSLTGGFGIRETSVVEYNDDDAIDWAKTHNLCLALDKKAFKIICKTQDIDFVKKYKTITVTKPKNIILDKKE